MPPKCPSLKWISVLILAICLTVVSIVKSGYSLDIKRVMSPIASAVELLESDDDHESFAVASSTADSNAEIEQLKSELRRVVKTNQVFQDDMKRLKEQLNAFSSRLDQLSISKVNVASNAATGIPKETTLMDKKSSRSIPIFENPYHEKATDAPPNEVLTRMSYHGVRFSDKFRPLSYNFTVDQRRALWEGFGSENLDTQQCIAPADTRKPIGNRLAYHGLGMNLLQLANYIMFASMNNYFIAMIQHLAYETKKGRLASKGLQAMFETHFSMLEDEHSICDIYESKCLALSGHCYDGYWENPDPNPKSNLWKTATSWIANFRAENQELHDAAKVLLMREALRMKPNSRRELDQRVAEALEVVSDKLKESPLQVAIHVRRTDKILGEAVLTPCESYMKALEHAVKDYATRKVLVHLMSDNSTVEQECRNAAIMFLPSSLKSKLSINFRYAKDRPDRSSTSATLWESTWQLLVDLRLMVESDVFVGTQSSNLGVIVCYLRLHHNCYGVEHARFLWDPKRSKIAR